MKGGEKMEVAGLGNDVTAARVKEIPKNKLEGFHQMLKKAVREKNVKREAEPSTQSNRDIKGAEDLLSFLQSNDLDQLAGGSNVPLDTHQDLLKTIKTLLGISDDKWSEILAGLQKKEGEKSKNRTLELFSGYSCLNVNQLELIPSEDSVQNLITDPFPQTLLGDGQNLSDGSNKDGLETILSGLSGINVNQLVTHSNENTVLFLKAVKLYQLLSDQSSPNSQQLNELLSSVQNKLQTLLQNNKNNDKLQFLQSTFSQVSKDMVNKTIIKDNSENLAGRLTGYNGTHPMFQQMPRAEQLSIMLGGTRESVSVNDLISQFESILSKSQFSKTGGVQKLSIKLFPENLGSLRIELIQKGESITARILTTTDAAKNTLESHLHSLKHAFEVQSIKVDNIEIDQQQSGFQQQRFNRDQQNQQEDSQEQNQEQTPKDETDSDFILSLEDAITNQEV